MVAFALNNSIAVLAGRNLTLTDFTYENDEIGQVFVDQLSILDFRGVSVSIFEMFDGQSILLKLLGSCCYQKQGASIKP